MRNWMKQLGTSLGLLMTVGTASTALAYPPQCMDVCSCSSSCASPCYEGTFRSTCSDWICGDYCRAPVTQATVTQEQQDAQEQQDTQEQQDASGDVCGEQAPRSTSAKS
ncbi:hypothetical protein F0U62_20570 [Cystobacter fuscus]|uniref:hypothetical protein n=1 Tax=Cystobacter fuscus TaxID=43 RepID=UPI002B2E8982|nr:hypothetical protein F0U62_20570 [Cystobacter fuscus]